MVSAVAAIHSSRVGHVTRRISVTTPRTKSCVRCALAARCAGVTGRAPGRLGLDFIMPFTAEAWQGGQDSNLQPAVLETAALPIAPPPSRVRQANPPYRTAVRQQIMSVSWARLKELDRLLGFAVRFVAPAEAAILAQLEPLAGLLLVLEGVVVAPLALGASHRNHHPGLFFRHRGVLERWRAEPGRRET